LTKTYKELEGGILVARATKSLWTPWRTIDLGAYDAEDDRGQPAVHGRVDFFDIMKMTGTKRE